MSRSPDELIELAQKLQRPLERKLKWSQLCDRYKRGEKTIFAECFLEARAETVRERELAAYASQKYKDYLELWDHAEKEYAKASVEYDNGKTGFDAYQSGLAFDRDAMKRNI